MKTLLIALTAALALPTAANAAPFMNGSFESGIAPGSFTTIAAGDSTSITGWVVGGGGVDYIGSYWVAAQGARSVDLSGNAPGILSQTFDTIVGQAYRVSFSLGGNGDGPPPSKSVSVFATGGATSGYAAPASSVPNIAYTPFSYLFTANSASTTLSFTGNDAGPYGAALDAVSVTSVPEPATWAMMILGVGAVGGVLRRRRQPALATA